MIRVPITSAILIAALTGVAVADDVPSLDAPTAKAKWQDYEGQKVRLSGGRLSGVQPDLDIAVYGAYGKDTIAVDTTGVDRAALADIAAACGAPNTDAIDACVYDVIGTMGANASKKKPRLTAPEFVKP